MRLGGEICSSYVIMHKTKEPLCCHVGLPWGKIVSFSTSKWLMEEVHVIAAPNTKTVSHCEWCVKFPIFGCVRLILFRNKKAQKFCSKSLVPVFWLLKHYIHRNILFQADF